MNHNIPPVENHGEHQSKPAFSKILDTLEDRLMTGMAAHFDMAMQDFGPLRCDETHDANVDVIQFDLPDPVDSDLPFAFHGALFTAEGVDRTGLACRAYSRPHRSTAGHSTRYNSVCTHNVTTRDFFTTGTRWLEREFSRNTSS